PMPYLKRTFSHFRMMNGWRGKSCRKLDPEQFNLFKAIIWRQGVVRSTRFRFWWQLLAIALLKPQLLEEYLATLGVGEHFFTYRYEVREQLLKQLELLKQVNLEEKGKAIAPDTAPALEELEKAPEVMLK
ncbi:MAG: DUF4070 domain-containing protein, partial [Kovacikia sp.]